MTSNCLFCGSRFTGRTNRDYCRQLCRKRAENARNKLKRLVSQYHQSAAAEQQAKADHDYATLHKSMGRRQRLLDEIEDFTKQHFFWESPDWLVAFHLRIGEIINRPNNHPNI